MNYKKSLQIEIQKKYGLITTVKKNDKFRNKLIRLKYVKDLDSETLKKYKKDYAKAMAKVKHKVPPEFNGGSQRMGFDNYIKKEYYKYDLIIDGYKYERPREYLRKIIENPKDYETEVVKHTILELLERKKNVEENYVDAHSEEDIYNMKEEQELRYQENENRKKLYKNTVKTVL